MVLIEQPLDDHAITPEAIQFPVTAMDADFRETEPLQKGAAGNVLRKNTACQLVHAGNVSRFDQRGEDRAAGAVAAIIPPYIDGELADPCRARPRAIGKGGGEGDGSRFLGVGNDYKLPSG